jgi:hypothetical protein
MLSKETKRWLRALGIAKILFEDQGYHSLYLKGIENFIWRKAMYSPKIKEELIPKLYLEAKAKRIRMTTLVNRVLEKALAGGDRAITEGPVVNNGGLPPSIIEDEGH